MPKLTHRHLHNILRPEKFELLTEIAIEIMKYYDFGKNTLLIIC